jgi:hypothetical protein
MVALQYMADTGLRKSRMALFATWNDIMDSKINADVLLIGASRCLVTLSPRILDSILQTNSFNIGLSGYQFNMEYARYKIYRQHNKKPSSIVLCLDYASLSERADLLDPQQFFPFYRDTLICKTIKEYNGAPSFAEKYIPLFKYNNNLNLFKNGISSFLGVSRDQYAYYYKGYCPQNKAWDSTFDYFKKANPKGIRLNPKPKNVQLLNQFVAECKKDSIQLIFVFPPVLHESDYYLQNKDSLMSTFKEVANDNNLPFFNYSTDTFCFRRGLFYNSQHMNIKGSESFCNRLASDLLEKNILLQKHR